MQAAHSQGILHRDLKPTNILVRRDGDEWQVKLIDFGLAVPQRIETTASRISVGHTILGQSIVGTILYAPPEQLGRLPGVETGPYSDVYAFGKLCCYALFRTTDLKYYHWNSIPENLVQVLGKCTEDRICDRYPDFDGVFSHLDGLTPNHSVDEKLENLDDKVESLERQNRQLQIAKGDLWEIDCPWCGLAQDYENDSSGAYDWCERCGAYLHIISYDGIEVEEVEIETKPEKICIHCPHCRRRFVLRPYKEYACRHCHKKLMINCDLEWFEICRYEHETLRRKAGIVDEYNDSEDSEDENDAIDSN